MVKFKLIGRTTDRFGKPLWEILGNLENNGVGRLVTRGSFNSYPEPSFYKIMKVETVAAPEVKPNEYQDYVRKCMAWVEFTFRGVTRKKYEEISNPTYKADYYLIPKSDEEIWYKRAKECQREMKIIDPHVKMPVILKELYKEHLKRMGREIPDEIKLNARIKLKKNNYYRLAEEGETPNYFLDRFGTPETPALYENIDATRHLFVGRKAWDDPAPVKYFDWMHT